MLLLLRFSLMWMLLPFSKLSVVLFQFLLLSVFYYVSATYMVSDLVPVAGFSLIFTYYSFCFFLMLLCCLGIYLPVILLSRSYFDATAVVTLLMI